MASCLRTHSLYYLPMTDVKILDRLLATRCENICYILSFMVRQHGLRGKNYVLSSGIIGKVSLLLKNRDRHLRLCKLI